MGEWLKPAVLKTVMRGNSLGGSNPSSSVDSIQFNVGALAEADS